eukprot:m.29783 g.29783  ORF g.29783 m.29783 type:complete len:548 (+) comp31229_c0_seq1:191-1834(+)
MDVDTAIANAEAAGSPKPNFTSEIFKIKVSNLPPYVGHGQIRKLFEKKLSFKPVKVKAQLSQNVAYVTFRSEKERQEAMETIQGFVWKKHELATKFAVATKDPMSERREERGEREGESEAKRFKADDESMSKLLNDRVTPLWEMDYEKQLELKWNAHAQVLKKLAREKDLKQFDWVKEKNEDGLMCVLEKTRESPIRSHYRSKSEFNVGRGPDGLATVGFRVGSYKDGDVRVMSPKDCHHVPLVAITVTEKFQDYVRESKLACFDPITHLGHWRMLTVRSTMTEDVMVIVHFHPQALAKDVIEAEVVKLKAFFSDGIASSVLLQLDKSIAVGNTAQQPCQLIYGEPYIQEMLLDLKFRISPEAFFQINTPAAEVLYSLISDFCAPTPETCLLDICCGTGTIGLTMAKSVASVTGIEMVPQAIEDAKVNADLNGIKNVRFVAGKAEDVFPGIIQELSRHGRGTLVGVVDPPRPGLHVKVIQAIRKCKELNRVIYVSCNPQAAYKNFADLCRPESSRLKGKPFQLTRAAPVDLFPMTKHCELVLLFERV